MANHDENEIDEEDIVLPDEQEESDSHYPKLSTPGGGGCAKDHDSALLQHVTLRRLRTIATVYGFGGQEHRKLKKLELFRLIWDAMLDDQECGTCSGGKCDPSKHFFPPSAPPPHGWVRGANGIFVPPQTAPTSSSPGQTQQHGPALQTSESAQGPSGIQNPTLMPGISALDPGPGQFHYTRSSTARRVGSPTAALLRATASDDLPAGSIAAPVVDNLGLPPVVTTDIAQVIRNGATDTSTTFAASAAVSSTGQPDPILAQQAEVDRRLSEQLAEARRKRQQEEEQLQQQLRLQQQTSQQQRLADYEAQRKQQLLAAQQAEELAHQQRMQQLRASLAATSHSPGTSPGVANPAGSLNTASPSFLAPPSSSVYFPAGAHANPSPVHTHGLSPSLGGVSPFPPLGSPAAPSPTGSFDFAQFDAYFEQKMRSMGHTHSHASTHCNPFSAPNTVSADKGRPVAHKTANADMAARFGVMAQPLFELGGNLEDIDMAKMRKIMTPGYDTVGPGIVLRQHRWPHRSLQSNTPGNMTAKHYGLTFHQLMNGWLSVVCTAIPKERLDPELANMLSFQQFLVQMSFHYSHDHVLETCYKFLMSWQMKEWEWTDPWSTLDERLKGIRSSFEQKDQPATHKRNHVPPGSGKGAGGGNGGAGSAPKQQPKTEINGVPKAYMKANNICIQYNGTYGCKDFKESHENKYAKGVTLAHVCAACHVKKVQNTHPCCNCGKSQENAALFRGW